MAKATGWSRGAVSGVLFRAGLNAGKERPAWVQKGDLKNPAWRRAADLYLQGKSRAEIAEAMGCNLESAGRHLRSEEHTSALQSLMRSSYALFRLKKTTSLLHTPSRPIRTSRLLTLHLSLTTIAHSFTSASAIH